jgi:signal transduction histidine kinase/CheY-like chemotaxis protein
VSDHSSNLSIVSDLTGLPGYLFLQLNTGFLKLVQINFPFDSTWFFSLFILLIFFVGYRMRKSELKKVESKKEAEVARRSTHLKEQFLANMSHEFRTPLNAIVGMTRLLRDNNPKPEQVKYLNAITQSSEHLMAIINDILDISKIEAGRIQLNRIPFEIREIMQGMDNLFRLKAGAKKLEFSVKTEEKVPLVFIGDPIRLQQVLSNIVGNAIKFTESGKVELSCSPEDYSIEDLQCTLKFVISDTGIGISDQNIDEVFETFSQEVSDTTRKHGGAGLGLSITKKLVDLFGGSMQVKSDRNNGSVFTILIPFEVSVVLTTVKDDDLSSESLRNDLKGISVLLVEDIEFNRIVALDTLTSELDGVEVDIATNGHEAVEMSSSKRYDIILMDLQMPVLNGYDATRKIRTLAKPNCDVPIIAMTASALEDEIYRCYEAGMNDFITKPFDTEILFKKILNQIRFVD